MLKNLPLILLLWLSGCTVYSGGYENPGYGRYDYRYNDGYRRGYPSPPVYVPGYYYEQRGYGYRPERRYLPPPLPPRYAPPPHYRGDHLRPVPPRYQHHPRHHDLRGGAMPRGGWERSDRRYPQEHYRERRRR